MATTYYEAEDCYSISGDSAPLTISVKCGDGQGCGYLIFLGPELIGSNRATIIREPQKFEDEWITISATVKDKLTETNWTSVTVDFENGSTSQRFGPYKREVAQHLDTVVYTVKIKMQR